MKIDEHKSRYFFKGGGGGSVRRSAFGIVGAWCHAPLQKTLGIMYTIDFPIRFSDFM